MARRKAQYIFWDHDLVTKDGKSHTIFTEVGRSFDKWPRSDFIYCAAKHGYHRLVKDDSLIGGYYVNDLNGHCLICYPAFLDINQSSYAE